MFFLFGERSHDTIEDGWQPDNQMDFCDTFGACCRLRVLLEVKAEKIHRVNSHERLWLIIITGILLLALCLSRKAPL
jgi:hypothetical protein